jgi:hypothetical protein
MLNLPISSQPLQDKKLVSYALTTFFASCVTLFPAMADNVSTTGSQPYPKRQNHSPFVHDAPNPDTDNEPLCNRLHKHNGATTNSSNLGGATQAGRPQINAPLPQNHPALSKTLKRATPANNAVPAMPNTKAPEVWNVPPDLIPSGRLPSVRVSPTPSQSDKQELIPSKTWLFCVGILTFSDGRAGVSFGTGNRRDEQLVSLLKDRGVPDDHICYIKDRNGTFSNIKRQFLPFLQGTQPGDLLIDYYTGHGGDGSFETCNGGSYDHSWIGNKIANGFRGSQVLLLGDCCESGSLEDVVADHADEPIGYACISSSSRTESGHGRWTFSQAVLDALNGEPYVDLDKDGYITVDELAYHVRQDILAYENNHSVYKKTANFNGGMIIARTKSGNCFTPIPVRVWYDGAWWKAKEVDCNADQARIRWIQLGYDSPDQDVWIDLDNVKPIKVGDD